MKDGSHCVCFTGASPLCHQGAKLVGYSLAGWQRASIGLHCFLCFLLSASSFVLVTLPNAPSSSSLRLTFPSVCRKISAARLRPSPSYSIETHTLTLETFESDSICLTSKKCFRPIRGAQFIQPANPAHPFSPSRRLRTKSPRFDQSNEIGS